MKGRTTTELRANLARLQQINRVATGKKDELHRGIARHEREIARREGTGWSS